MQIITEEMVRLAISLVAPTAESILALPGATWGPRWVEGSVSAPGLPEDIPFQFGYKTEWDPAWGVNRGPFAPIAKAKLKLAKRLGNSTSTMTAVCPWQLQPGEYLYPGACSHFGISAGVSGAKGRTDEALAELMVATIIMLAHLETDRRKEAKQMQI